MESARRSFDRSREPGLKKPRFAGAQPNPNGRPFAPRPSLPPQPRYSVASTDRDSESNDFSRGSAAAYHPQPTPYQELVSQYKAALAELTFNSKPIITNLTIIAGENQHAAKAIAATVCANILEVPSDQKLPSLYLLDSIVKNIGRDYIKYFAARLPEVFCKAYRHIDPSVHSSMEHLFGTWKGVFPPQTLEIIERELGFASVANGSSSTLTTSRPDSHSQRPPHSIHVNPKYLERQRLQQSSSAKGKPDSMNLHITNSSGDVERSERSASIGSGRSWRGGTIKTHNAQRSHKEVMGDPVLEKKISSACGDYESSSDVQRSSSMGGARTGKVLEQGHDKPWYDTGSSIPGVISGQRNGLNLKQGLPKLSATKAPNLHLEPPQSISSSGMSPSWKNSEEEEFMWEMHSRVSDNDIANFSSNSRKGWTPVDAEKLDFENHLRRPQSVHEFGLRFDRENSSDSLSSEQKEQSGLRHHLSSPWRLQDSHSGDGHLHSGGLIAGHSDGHSASPGVLAVNADSLTKMAVRPRTTSSSQIANSEFGFSAYGLSGSCGMVPQHSLPSLGVSPSLSAESLTHQRPPSPLFPARHVHQELPNPSDKGYVQSSHQIKKPHLQPVSNNGTLSTSGSDASDQSNSPTVETSGQSSTSSLLAAVMKTGILSNIASGGLPAKNIQDVKQVPPKSSIQLPIPSITSERKNSKSEDSSIPLSSPLRHDSSLTNPSVSPRKKEQLPLPPGPTSTQDSDVLDKCANPLSNLLSSLVAKGLISAPKSNTSSPSHAQSQNKNQNQNQNIRVTTSKSTSIPSLPDTTSISLSTEEGFSTPHPAAKGSTASLQSSTVEVENLIGLEFKSDVIRELHPPVISSLFDDIQHQCVLCGLQLKLKRQLDRHMEWHTLKRVDSDCTNMLSRRWFADAGDWATGTAEPPLLVESPALLNGFGELIAEDEPMVPADEDQCLCILCGELFQDYYSQERNKWMFKGTTYLTLPLGDGKLDANKNSKGSIVHVNCASQSSVSDSGMENLIKIEKGA
ncbi:hypothetical protein K2173_002085 [Erythroxylum novogranatense]|uniref:CID domain-containing protein n=1 Tax=Erythroxylum novogranatense TaxID=1862640 RepID=A0AAV8SQ90_9ROSI|nr:hypothetical protein K2173_002085 [Erythroxylum novogranatense]